MDNLFTTPSGEQWRYSSRWRPPMVVETLMRVEIYYLWDTASCFNIKTCSCCVQSWGLRLRSCEWRQEVAARTSSAPVWWRSHPSNRSCPRRSARWWKSRGMSRHWPTQLFSLSSPRSSWVVDRLESSWCKLLRGICIFSLPPFKIVRPICTSQTLFLWYPFPHLWLDPFLQFHDLTPPCSFSCWIVLHLQLH